MQNIIIFSILQLYELIQIYDLFKIIKYFESIAMTIEQNKLQKIQNSYPKSNKILINKTNNKKKSNNKM
jgi:hypothetical protein